MNKVLDWFGAREHDLLNWMHGDDKYVLEFFAPLMEQVKATAIQLGKDDLKVGLQILRDAAVAAAMSAAAAPEGTSKVAAAEAAFLTVGAAEGITAIHNAEAGAIKAAVALVQSHATATNS